MGVALAMLFLSLAPGCSSGDSGGGASATWKCCTLGVPSSVCHCFKQGPNSATLCSDEVASCGDVDGGLGCCMAGIDECECSAPGEACPTSSDISAVQVATCPG